MALNGKRIKKFYESKKQDFKDSQEAKAEAKRVGKEVYKRERASFLKSEATRKAKEKARGKGGMSLKGIFGSSKPRPTSRGQPRSEKGWASIGSGGGNWASFGGGASDWSDYSPSKVRTTSKKKKTTSKKKKTTSKKKKKKRSDLFDL